MAFFLLLHTVARSVVFFTLGYFLPRTTVTLTFLPEVKRLSAASMAFLRHRGCPRWHLRRHARRWRHRRVSCFTRAFRDPPTSTVHY